MANVMPKRALRQIISNVDLECLWKCLKKMKFEFIVWQQIYLIYHVHILKKTALKGLNIYTIIGVNW